MQKKILQKAKALVREFDKGRPERASIIELCEKMGKACRRVERSWSGSFAGWHGRTYFKNFEIPSIYERFNGEWGGINGMPDGWKERQPEEVKAEIERLAGNNLSIDKLEKETRNIKEDAARLRHEIMILFSDIQFDQQLEKERDLINQIEKFKFGDTKADFVNQNLPKTIMTRDTEALRQGICLASWLYYDGIAWEGKSTCESIEEFINVTDRFIRQMERKLVSGNKTKQSPCNLLTTLHIDIYKKCHDLFEKGAYAEAVEKSFKVVRDRLRTLTSHETGSEAFGKGKLHIRGAAAQNVDHDFNEAVKFLTMAIDRFRNEKSHTSDAKIDDPTRAYEYLRLSSLAMNLLDNAEILPKEGEKE